MSFLTKSKANFSGNSPVFFSKADEKAKQGNSSPKANSLGESLEDFRQGLRQQLAQKHAIDNSKYIVSSVQRKSPGRNLKERFETTLLINQRDNHKKVESNYQRGDSSPVSAKNSEKKFDLVRELARKFDETSITKRPQTKNIELLTSSIDKRSVTPTPSNTTSSFMNLYSKRDKSPMNNYALTIDTKTPKATRTTFLDDKFSSRTPQEKWSNINDDKYSSRTSQDRKDNLLKLLERTNISKPQNANSSATAQIDLTRSRVGLAQNLSQLRASRTTLLTQTPERKSPERVETLASTPTNYSRGSLKSLTSFVSDSFKRKETEKDKSIDKYLTKKPSFSNGYSETQGYNLERSPTNRQSSSKLHGPSSFFSNTLEKEGNTRSFKGFF